LLRSRTDAARTVLALAAAVLLATGCQPADSDSAKQADPSSSAGSTSGGAGDKEVCLAIAKAVLDTSKKIADESVAAIEQGKSEADRNKQLQATFAELATELEAQAAKATDPALKAEIEKSAAGIEAGAKSADPTAFVGTDFVKLATAVDKSCKA